MTLHTNCVRTIQYESPHQLLPGLLVQASFLSTPLIVSTLTHSLIKNRLRRTLYVKQQPTNKQQKQHASHTHTPKAGNTCAEE